MTETDLISTQVSDETIEEIFNTIISHFPQEEDKPTIITKEQLRDVLRSDTEKFSDINQVTNLAELVSAIGWGIISLDHAVLLAKKIDFSKLSEGNHFEVSWVLANSRIGSVELFPILIANGLNVAEVRDANSPDASDVLDQIVRQSAPETVSYATDVALVTMLLETGTIEDFQDTDFATQVIEKLRNNEITTRDLVGEIGERSKNPILRKAVESEETLETSVDENINQDTSLERPANIADDNTTSIELNIPPNEVKITHSRSMLEKLLCCFGRNYS